MLLRAGVELDDPGGCSVRAAVPEVPEVLSDEASSCSEFDAFLGLSCDWADDCPGELRLAFDEDDIDSSTGTMQVNWQYGDCGRDIADTCVERYSVSIEAL